MRELFAVFGMAGKIVFEAGGFQGALSDGDHLWRLDGHRELGLFYLVVERKPFVDFILEQRIVRAAEHKRVDERVFVKNLPQVFSYEIFRARTVMLACFYQRHPHRTRLLCDGQVRRNLLKFQHIALGADSGRCA